MLRFHSAGVRNVAPPRPMGGMQGVCVCVCVRVCVSVCVRVCVCLCAHM